MIRPKGYNFLNGKTAHRLNKCGIPVFEECRLKLVEAVTHPNTPVFIRVKERQ